MRGEVDGQVSMFSYVDMESRIGEAHPIRAVRRIVDAALAELEPALSRMYAERGRPVDTAGASAAGACCCRCCTRCVRSGC